MHEHIRDENGLVQAHAQTCLIFILFLGSKWKFYIFMNWKKETKLPDAVLESRMQWKFIDVFHSFKNKF